MFLFNLNSTTPLRIITPSDGADYQYFGSSISAAEGGFIVGAKGHSSDKGAAYVFDADGNFIQQITAADGLSNNYFGSAVAIKADRIVVGAMAVDVDGSFGGAAYFYGKF